MDEARKVIRLLTEQKKTLVTAESCTGGLLGKLLTDVPGASAVYLGGVITYAYALKERLLDVDPSLLERKGAVCEEVAVSMAKNARQKLNADYAISVTGNAGPGSDEKNPNVGEIYVAVADYDGCVCQKLDLKGDREQNRMAACCCALLLLLQRV
ncbi:MAG: CinA family protein [Ruminococcaceae bacterium]|nr:CinA family protein [Oscillospiraceae bacterium]